MNIVSYHLDYLRFLIHNDNDFQFVSNRLEYLAVNNMWFHGSRYVDITGSQLELMRMVESVFDVSVELSTLYDCARIDVAIDVLGDVLGDISQPGTVIMNNGRVETVYSMRLNSRGDVPVFARAYDARAAGHYDYPVTRFEVEYKNAASRRLLSSGVWRYNPFEVAMYNIAAIYGYSIEIPGLAGVEFNPPARKIQHSRERWLGRIGKKIIEEIETMGAGAWYEWVLECVKQNEREKQSKRNLGKEREDTGVWNSDFE
jgi:hypothetical protein